MGERESLGIQRGWGAPPNPAFSTLWILGNSPGSADGPHGHGNQAKRGLAGAFPHQPAGKAAGSHVGCSEPCPSRDLGSSEPFGGGQRRESAGFSGNRPREAGWSRGISVSAPAEGLRVELFPSGRCLGTIWDIFPWDPHFRPPQESREGIISLREVFWEKSRIFSLGVSISALSKPPGMEMFRSGRIFLGNFPL